MKTAIPLLVVLSLPLVPLNGEEGVADYWWVRESTKNGMYRVVDMKHACKIVVADGKISLFRENGGKLEEYFTSDDPRIVSAIRQQVDWSPYRYITVAEGLFVNVTAATSIDIGGSSCSLRAGVVEFAKLTDPAKIKKVEQILGYERSGSITSVAGQEKIRNPFNVEDVTDPDGEDVKAFAARQELSGDTKDANASQWAEKTTSGKTGSLDGEWSSRWSGGTAGQGWISGTASVKTIGDRVYILYQDQTNRYLIDARREGKNRLVGRYMNLGMKTDSTPWAGFVIDDQRIDGIWTQGRWDLRRSLAPEKKPN